MNDQLEITSRERTTFTRREFVAGAAGAMAVSLIPAVARAGAGKPSTGDITMSRGYIKTKDGVDIFYKDWGPKSAQPIVFHHGWPLSSDDWDAQMLFFHSHGYRVVAHDRRGHGRYAQVDWGPQLDSYARASLAGAGTLALPTAGPTEDEK